MGQDLSPIRVGMVFPITPHSGIPHVDWSSCHPRSNCCRAGLTVGEPRLVHTYNSPVSRPRSCQSTIYILWNSRTWDSAAEGYLIVICSHTGTGASPHFSARPIRETVTALYDGDIPSDPYSALTRRACSQSPPHCTIHTSAIMPVPLESQLPPIALDRPTSPPTPRNAARSVPTEGICIRNGGV